MIIASVIHSIRVLEISIRILATLLSISSSNLFFVAVLISRFTTFTGILHIGYIAEENHKHSMLQICNFYLFNDVPCCLFIALEYDASRRCRYAQSQHRGLRAIHQHHLQIDFESSQFAIPEMSSQ